MSKKNDRTIESYFRKAGRGVHETELDKEELRATKRPSNRIKNLLNLNVNDDVALNIAT